jgi:putative Holliday junction resolvase
MSRILALDLGEKRIGVAVSDAMNIIAQAIGTIERRDIKSDIKKIAGLTKEYGASRIIIGLPFNMSGSQGKGCQQAIDFANALKKEMPIDVEMVDERLTTAQGERVLIEADLSRKKRRKNIDKLAAQLILQGYLDSNTHNVQKNNS